MIYSQISWAAIALSHHYATPRGIMESLAFIHHSVAYTDPSPEPQLRSFGLADWQIPSSAWMGLVGAMTLFSILSIATPVEAMIYRVGSTGPVVSEIQRSLGLSIDGVYGPETELAIRNYQASMGLLADGKAGPETLEALGLGDVLEVVDVAPTFAGGQAMSGQVVIVTRSGVGVNLRGAPNGAITGGLPDGAVVLLTGREVTEGGYRWAELSDGQWVASNFLGNPSAPVAEMVSYSTSASPAVTGSGTAVVATPGGTGVNLRRTPNGEVVASVANGSTVFLTGAEVAAGDYVWAETTDGAWVATAFLTGDVGQGAIAPVAAPAARPVAEVTPAATTTPEEATPAVDEVAVAEAPAEPIVNTPTETAVQPAPAAPAPEAAAPAPSEPTPSEPATSEPDDVPIDIPTADDSASAEDAATDVAPVAPSPTPSPNATPTPPAGEATGAIAGESGATVAPDTGTAAAEGDTPTDGAVSPPSDTPDAVAATPEPTPPAAAPTETPSPDAAADPAVDAAPDSAEIPADEEFQGPEGSFTVKAPTELRSDPGGSAVTTLMPGEAVQLTQRRSLSNGRVWAQTTDGAWVDAMSVDLDGNAATEPPPTPSPEPDVVETPASPDDTATDPADDSFITSDTDFQGPSGTFTTEASIDRYDAPGGEIVGSVAPESDFEITERRTLRNGVVWAQLADGSWVDARQVDGAIASANEATPSPEPTPEPTVAASPEPTPAASPEPTPAEPALNDSYVFQGPSGNFSASATIEKRDAPYGLVTGSVGAGERVELTGKRTFALNRTWAELSDGTWVDIRNLQAN